MAEIEYEVREQDLMAFSDHQLRNSEPLQKAVRRHQGTIPGMLVLIAAFIWFYYQDSLAAITVGVTAAVWGVLAPFYYRWNARRQVQRLFSQEEKSNIVGAYRLRTQRDGLLEISRSGESKVKWDDVLRVETNNRYAFIFVSVDSALVIPRATVKSGDLHEFVKEVDERIDASS